MGVLTIVVEWYVDNYSPFFFLVIETVSKSSLLSNNNNNMVDILCRAYQYYQ